MRRGVLVGLCVVGAATLTVFVVRPLLFDTSPGRVSARTVTSASERTKDGGAPVPTLDAEGPAGLGSARPAATREEGGRPATEPWGRAGQSISMSAFLELPEAERAVLADKERALLGAFMQRRVATPAFYACIRRILPRSANRQLNFTAHFLNDTDAWIPRPDDEPVSVDADPPLEPGRKDALAGCAIAALAHERVPFGTIGGAEETYVLHFAVDPYPP